MHTRYAYMHTCTGAAVAIAHSGRNHPARRWRISGNEPRGGARGGALVEYTVKSTVHSTGWRRGGHFPRAGGCWGWVDARSAERAPAPAVCVCVCVEARARHTTYIACKSR